jgi:hypothetical protein
MGIRERMSSRQKAAVVSLFAISLCAAPVVGTVIGTGEPVYTYERAEIVVDDNRLAYEGELDELGVSPPATPLYEHIDCSYLFTPSRVCPLESYVLENGPIPTQEYSQDTNKSSFFDSPTPYVFVGDALYRRTSSTNTSVTNEDGSYRVEIDLEPADPQRVREEMAVSVDFDRIPPVIAETVREGKVRSTDDAPTSAFPVVAKDGSYYSVLKTESAEPPYESGLPPILWLGPPGGVAVFVWLWSRAEISFDL